MATDSGKRAPRNVWRWGNLGNPFYSRVSMSALKRITQYHCLKYRKTKTNSSSRKYARYFLFEWSHTSVSPRLDNWSAILSVWYCLWEVLLKLSITHTILTLVPQGILDQGPATHLQWTAHSPPGLAPNRRYFRHVISKTSPMNSEVQPVKDSAEFFTNCRWLVLNSNGYKTLVFGTRKATT